MDIERQNVNYKQLSRKTLASLNKNNSPLAVEINLAVVFYNLALVSSSELINPTLVEFIIDPSDLIDARLCERVEGAMRAFKDQPQGVQSVLQKAAKYLGKGVSPSYVEDWLNMADDIITTLDIDLAKGFWERAKGGRPAGMTQVNRLIAERAIKIRTHSKQSWSSIVDLLIGEFSEKSELSSDEKLALKKLEEARTRLNNQALEDYIWRLVKRYENSTRT